MFLLILLSCSADKNLMLDTDYVDNTVTVVDADQDGYLSSEDCNDGDATLNLIDADGDGMDSCSGDCDDACDSRR